MYQYGQGVVVSDATSIAWYRKAAERRDAEGETIWLSCTTPVKAYHMTTQWPCTGTAIADQGNASAEQNLAVGYYKGQGEKQDHQKAYVWSSLAAVHYPSSGSESRANALRARELAASDQTRS